MTWTVGRAPCPSKRKTGKVPVLRQRSLESMIQSSPIREDRVRLRTDERDPTEQPLTNALTIDVEDYYQVTAFEKQVSRNSWENYESRVVANTHRILRLLEARGVRGTFFILGWVARHYPELVRDIFRSGHEIGSH